MIDFGKQVDVLGMAVSDNDIVHADYHGAVVIPPAALDKLPAAIDLMARKEKVVLDAARKPGFDPQKMREAMAAADLVK
jgi:regulator of RNase E activity RraA